MRTSIEPKVMIKMVFEYAEKLPTLAAVVAVKLDGTRAKTVVSNQLVTGVRAYVTPMPNTSVPSPHNGYCQRGMVCR